MLPTTMRKYLETKPMNSFKEFLTAQGVHNVDDLILFLENLPSDPEGMVNMINIERYEDKIDSVFDIFFDN